MNSPKSSTDLTSSDNLPTDAEATHSSPNVVAGGAAGNRDLAELLREAMPNATPPVDVLAGVQQRLRERSGGKFYADRWSTERFPPIPTYLVTSAFMLAIVLATYFVLRPLSGEPARSPTPAPVRILPPNPNR